MNNTTKNTNNTYKTLINKIDSITQEVGALAPKYHALAVEVLSFHFATGDIRPVNALIEKSPKLIKKNDLKAWFNNFGAMSYNVKLDEMLHDKDKMDSMDSSEQLQLAEATPFFEFRKEKPVIIKTGADILKDLIKSIEFDLTRKEAKKWTVEDLATANSWLHKLESKGK